MSDYKSNMQSAALAGPVILLFNLNSFNIINLSLISILIKDIISLSDSSNSV